MVGSKSTHAVVGIIRDKMNPTLFLFQATEKASM